MAQLVNTIAPIMTETGGGSWRQTTYYPFLHASLYGRGVALQQVVRSPSYTIKYDRTLSWWNRAMGMRDTGEKEIPVIESVAVINDRDLTIFAVNKDPLNSSAFTCEIRGFDEYVVAEYIVMEHGDLKAKNTATDPDNVKPHAGGDAKVKANMIIATLPVLSWNVIRLKRKN
jgi:alpha-N-arabinofuranosidase